MSDVIFPSELTNATPIWEDRLLFSDTSDSWISKDCAFSDLPISDDTQNALDEKVDDIIAWTNITVIRSGNNVTINSLWWGGGSGNAGAFAYELQTATAWQTVFDLWFDYVLWNNLMVFLEWGKQVYTAHYNETDINTVTFLSWLDEWTKVEFVYLNKGLNWKWVYSWSTTYKVDDAVSYDWSSYICILESTWNLPTNASYFDVLVSKGEQGEPWIWDMQKSENLSWLANYTTARTNLDVHSKSEVVTLIDNATVWLLDDRGSYDASVNTFPTTGWSWTAGAVKKGDLWFISVWWVLWGQTVTVWDSVRALVDTPWQTATNWNIIKVNINYVPENSANKVIDVDANKTSNTFFASVKAIYDWATGLFYTKSEVNSLAGNYYTKTALDWWQLDNRYYTETEINSLAWNYALKTGATFTGAISATNLSNTNTGDQTITPWNVTATAWQTVFTTPTYVIWNNKLMVFVNGFLQEKTTHYTETSTTSITFWTWLDAWSIVTYRILS